MSGVWSAVVMEHYPSGGGEYLLALVLADSADEMGYVTIETTLEFLRFSRLTEAGFHRALAKMKAKGWLILIDASECWYQLRNPGGPRRKKQKK
ncbi:hypothetical protein [uncultured Ramlibacter sp.]|uniref:hypothetical protein n=1 Tax=uncultured Ramlibacter sp. TaxID=260755 RepID=UPI00261E68DD|nr:hypothetical protein [uncultured Ramlibacter sp.]